MRETIVIHSRLAWREVRGKAAIARNHGIQALAIEHLVARLAGGFLQPIDADSLNIAVIEAIKTDLGEFQDIKMLPGFARAAAATLEKAWTADLKLDELAKSADPLIQRRIDAMMRLEREVLSHLPKSMRRPSDLIAVALGRLQHAKMLFGDIRIEGRTEMSPVWRPLLAALKDATDLKWVAGPRAVPAWVRDLGIKFVEVAPEKPEIACESCASPRHEALEAMRWARALISAGTAKPEEIAIAAASPMDWDDHFLALEEMAGIDLHFVHGRKALATPEGQLAAALSEVLLRGFSQARMTRLIGLLRTQNSDFEGVPSNWWRILPEDAPLLDATSWRAALDLASNNADPAGKAVVGVLSKLVDALATGLKRAGEVGQALLRGRSLTIWEHALSEGPPEALDVTLSSLALSDQVPQESNVIWAPASALAANPRAWVRLVGFTSRAWPRHQAEDPLLPNHIVPSSTLDPLPVHQADRRDLIRSSKRPKNRSSARTHAAMRRGASTVFLRSIRESPKRYTASAPVFRSMRPAIRTGFLRGRSSSMPPQVPFPRDHVGSIGIRIG